jgi:hypothetical protein
MGDPEETVTYYDIVPNSSFEFMNTVFMPARKYTVKAEVYDATLPDGSPFASRCASARPRTGTPG